MHRGDVVFRQNDNMLATMWLDNDVVTLLSDNVQPGKTEIIRRKQKDGKHLQISRCHYCAKHRSTPETFWYCEECMVHFCHSGTIEDCYI